MLFAAFKLFKLCIGLVLVNMNIRLRKWYFNALFFKGVIDGEAQLCHNSRRIVQISHPNPEFEVKGAVPEVRKEKTRFGIRKHIGIVFHYLHDYVGHKIQICVIGDIDQNGFSHHFAVMRPVGER